MHPDQEPLADVVPLLNRHDAGTAPAQTSSVGTPASASSSPMFGTAPSYSGYDIDAAPHPAGQPYAYGSLAPGGYLGEYAPVPSLPSWAPAVLDEPFVLPDGVVPPAIWSQFQRAVESIPEAALRGSVLRAGWLALRDELGEA